MASRTIYHVFTDERDEWYEDIVRARGQFEEWAEEYGTARLYEETLDENDELIDENCLESVGEWPQ